jgi:(2Fe-2S) ferredoxin
MNRCEKGPLMVVYPAGSWYSEVNEEKIDSILDALAEGNEATEYLLS